MIDVSFSTVCLFYLSLTLMALFTVGFRSHLKKKDFKKLEVTTLCICEYCQHMYLDDIDLHITSCPQCLLLNKKNS